MVHPRIPATGFVVNRDFIEAPAPQRRRGCLTPQPLPAPNTLHAGYEGWYGGASPQPHLGTGACGGGVAPGWELASAMRVPHSM
jgi:hypothetical protein